MNSIDSRYVRRLMPDEDGGYTATIHEFPGCIADGDTADEAIQNLEKAAKSWIEAAEESGYHVCPPLDFDGASGKIALRISRRLHRLAAERAALEGTSLNQLISNAVASYLGQTGAIQRAIDSLQQVADRAKRTQFIVIPTNAGNERHKIADSGNATREDLRLPRPAMDTSQIVLQTSGSSNEWQLT